MKKLISLLLALVMVFSLATVVFATSTNQITSDVNITDNKATITKTYYGVGNGTSPAETFEFVNLKAVSVTNAAEGVTAENMPMISVGSVYFAEGAAIANGTEGTVEIVIPGVSDNPAEVNIPTDDSRFDVYPSVGIYTYSFNEKNNYVAGVSYYTATMTLVVSVIQGEDGLLRVAGVHCEYPAHPSYETDADGNSVNKKTDDFENYYFAGTLEVSKTVTGAYGDRSQYFDVEVTFTAPQGMTVKSDIYYEGGSKNYKTSIDAETGWTISKTVNLQVKNGDTINFTNIPYGVSYTVKETLTDDYTEYVTNNDEVEIAGNTAQGTISRTLSDASVEFRNDKGGDIDTGITLDTLPFVLILAVCAGAVVLFVVKRRRSTEF